MAWFKKHVGGLDRDGVHEYEIVDDAAVPVFYLSGFGISGATVHMKPEHAALICTATDLLAAVRRYASECKYCDGHGNRMIHPAGAVAVCFACAEIRELISKAEGS